MALQNVNKSFKHSVGNVHGVSPQSFIL